MGSLIPPLTRREVEVVELAAQGKSDKEIAVALGMSVHTVGVHWRNLRGKFDSASRTGIVAEVLRAKVRTIEQSLEERQAELEKVQGMLLHIEKNSISEQLLSKVGANAAQSFSARLRLDKLEAIAEELEKFEQFLETVGAMVYACNPEPPMQCIFMSRSVERYGVDREEIMSGRVSHFAYFHEEDLGVLLQEYEKEDETSKDRFTFLFRFGKGDAQRYILDTSRNYFDADGNCLFYAGCAIDVQPLIDAGRLSPDPFTLRVKVDEPPS